MTQQDFIDRIKEDIQKDPLYPMMTPRRMNYYLSLTFAAGFDEGSRSRSNRKAVEQYSPEGEYMREFNSTAEAKRITGVDNSTIINVCKGRIPLAGGYGWKYKEEPITTQIKRDEQN